MDPQNSDQQALSHVIDELGAVIRRQAHGRWKGVQTAQRKEGARQVWRFRAGPGAPERFLHIPRRSMSEGENPAAVLLAQLSDAQWLDRLQDGPATSFLLSPAGRLKPWSKQ